MSEILVPALIVLGLVLLNGLFVAAEFAIVGAPRATVAHMAERGDRRARRVSEILDDPRQQDRFIATAQIGITVASLGLGMYGEHALAEWLAHYLEPINTGQWIATHALASVLSIAILTYLHIVIGEMVPKALALQHAAGTVLWVAPPMLGLQRAILPLVVGLNALGMRILRLAGIRRQEVGAERYHTTEELQFIIEESQEGGLLRGESGQILQELFEFGDLTAGEVMVPRVHVVGIPVGAGPDDLRTLVRTHLHTRYPVYESNLDNIIGSLHIKDLLRLIVTNRTVAPPDARPLPYVPGPSPLDGVLSAMRRQRSQMAVVMDQHGGTAGLITIEDLFEEVVGEIEEGRGRMPIVRDAAGRLHARGTVRLEELAEPLGHTLAHPKVTTISGLVLTLLGRPACVGDVVTFQDVRIEVTAVAGRGVQDVVITPPPDAPPTRKDGNKTSTSRGDAETPTAEVRS
jgi:CBS domain containing-hemolysin-like protein